MLLLICSFLYKLAFCIHKTEKMYYLLYCYYIVLLYSWYDICMDFTDSLNVDEDIDVAYITGI